MYYKKADAVILCYDGTNAETYENLNFWVSQLKEQASPYIAVFCCQTKCDCSELEEVPFRVA